MKWIRKTLLSLASLLMALLALELGLHLFVPTNTATKWPTPHPRYGFFSKPGVRQTIRYAKTNAQWTVSINHMGMRGPFPDLSRSNDLRILLLGDSFTFGYGVSDHETFGARLQQFMDNAGLTATVINVSAAGWGTRQQILFADDHLREFRPDIVIATFCGNDLFDDEVFAMGKASGLMPSFPGKRFFREHSRIYGYLYEMIYGRLYLRLAGEKTDLQVMSKAAVQTNAIPPATTALSLDGTRAQWSSFMARVREIRPEAWMIVQAAEFWNGLITAPLFYAARDGGFTYMPLEREFASEPREQLILGFDAHWNARTHERVAKCLFTVMRDRLQPTPPPKE